MKEKIAIIKIKISMMNLTNFELSWKQKKKII